MEFFFFTCTTLALAEADALCLFPIYLLLINKMQTATIPEP
jgi:hypothetical protein